LLRGGIAWRTKRHGISRLSWFEVAGDTKVDEVEMTIGCPHDIGWFEITEDDGRYARVQVVKHSAELETDIEDFLKREMPTLCFLQIVLQIFAFNEL
jgi:hypothetical protein